MGVGIEERLADQRAEIFAIANLKEANLLGLMKQGNWAIIVPDLPNPKPDVKQILREIE